MKRWPILRHIRYLYHLRMMRLHYAAWRHAGYLPTHAEYDYEVLDQIWRGEA